MGRGSANGVALATVVVFIILMVQTCNATEYIVGDATGWNRDAAIKWPVGKHFKAGDVLVFKYDCKMHNVVEVNEPEYKICEVPENAKSYVTGDDRVILKKGGNFFICGFPGHCENNMKMAIIAE